MAAVSDALLNEIARRVTAAMHPDTIILFGSHAWGAPHESSDVDLFVIVPHSDEPAYRRARAVYRALHGIGVPIDAVVLTREEAEQGRRVKTSLAARVFAEGRLLHG